MNTTCTPDDVTRLMAKLHADFGGWPYGDDERREFAAMCRSFAAQDVSEAIGRLRNSGEHPDRLPRPAQVATVVQAIRAERRRAARETERREPWPEQTPAAVRRHVEALRQQFPQCWPKRQRSVA